MKTELTAIVAVSENNVIGSDGGLPWYLPQDLKRFKEMTLGKPVIMGRGVWDSLPKKPLTGRQNIILTRQDNFQSLGALNAHSPIEALQLAGYGEVPEIMIIGGEQVYKLFWDRLTKLEVTRIHSTYEGDTFFPEIGLEWVLQQSLFISEADQPDLSFQTFVKVEGLS